MAEEMTEMIDETTMEYLEICRAEGLTAEMDGAGRWTVSSEDGYKLTAVDSLGLAYDRYKRYENGDRNGGEQE